MTPLSDQEVLEQCFAIVSSNGYKGDLPVYDDTMGQWHVTDGDGGYVPSSITELLFDLGFARCLFGEDLIVSHAMNSVGQSGSWHSPAWMHYLKELAVAEDRIDYLRRWLEQRKEQ
jgi:hypothetical protein